MQVLTRPLNIRFNFNKVSYYLLECSRSIYSSFAVSIINPVRCLCLFKLSFYPDESIELIICNVEFYWDFESTFFSRFTHRGE